MKPFMLSKTSIANPLMNYSSIVESHGIKFSLEDRYIVVGFPTKTQGWILHITVIPSQMRELLDEVLPVLQLHHLKYKIVENVDFHKDINAGIYGPYKIGKIITIFLEDESIVECLMASLIEVTKQFIGPPILTDFFISNVIFTRYGAFTSRIEIDGFGYRLRVIEDGNGNPFLDQYYTPPVIPNSISNPFISFVKTEQKTKKYFLIGNKYMPLQILKSDPRGNVWRALYFTKMLIPKWAVIKQGTKGMFQDDFGRDIKDRLQWQFHISKTLKDLIVTPEVMEYLEEDGHGYIATKYVKGGIDLTNMITNKLNHTAWLAQSISIKIDILDILINIIQQIRIMHENGYLHRDITGPNFLVSTGKKVHLIDLELAYSIKGKSPTPPFGVGTPGYMSPGQAVESPPQMQDDSYSIAALMILIFSCAMPPVNIIEQNKIRLRKKLNYLIGNNDVAEMINHCLSIEPSQRPSIDAISKVIKTYRDGLKQTQIHRKPQLPQDESVSALISDTITMAVLALAGKSMSINGLWFSYVNNVYGRDVYPLGDKHFFGSLYRGIGGAIYLMTKLQESGYEIRTAQFNIKKGLYFLQTNVIPNVDQNSPSLYHGNAGLAIALVKSIQGGFIEDTPELRATIKKCFSRLASSYDILYGIAGQGLGIMQCRDYIDESVFLSTINQYKEILISEQETDGSWSKYHASDKKPEKISGFGYGIAGIVFFLLEHSIKYRDTTSLTAAEKGLTYLNSIAINKKGHLEWRNSSIDKTIGAWWCKGSPGIALTFLKAYELSGSKQYLAIAEKSLQFHPKQIIHNNLGQCHGLSGLGEVYLEAFRLTQNEEWLLRANWIAQLLIHLQRENNNKEAYWYVERNDFATADFMIGNSGVLHFLNRYCHQDKMQFPILL